MASSTSRVLAKLSSRLQPIALNLINKKASMATVRSVESLSMKSSSESSVKRFSVISRLPVELGSVDTMLPLHSAIASARLRSGLPMDSQVWGLVPQGISLPL